MKTLSFWLWLVAFAVGLGAAAQMWDQGFNPAGNVLFGVFLVAGLLGCAVDLVRWAAR